MKRLESLFYSRLNVWRNRTKKLLKLLAMSIRLVRNSPLLLTVVFGDSDSLVFREIIDLVPLHAFFNIIFSIIFEIITFILFFTLLH